MKILRIKVIEAQHRPLLHGIELDFSTSITNPDGIDPNILIGINGSGKSQLLETFAEIFLYLDRIFRHVNTIIVSPAPLLFELDYLITRKGKIYRVAVNQHIVREKAPEVLVWDENDEEIPIRTEDINDFLPSKVIGYTSGDNETLSLPFTDYYDEYAKYTGERALVLKSKELKDYEPRFYLMDYNTNIGVMISNLVLGDRQKINALIDYVGINSLRSFQIIIQTKHSAAPGKGGVELTPELRLWIEQLKASATCFQYFPAENRFVLDFYINEATITALKHFFKTPINFYTALYKIELLNNLIIKDAHLKNIKRLRALRRLIIKPPTVSEQDKVLSYSEVKLKLDSNAIVDYINLSDGEHQFLNIFGTILMTDFENCLYLLDEPETHFNPKWRREFINLLFNITAGRKQDFFITSHSPFIVADSKRDKVYIFQKLDGKLDIKWPIEETYGSDTDYILKVAFGLDTSLSKKSYDELKDLMEIQDAEILEQKIGEFGDSAEKLFLFKRLQELKAEQK